MNTPLPIISTDEKICSFIAEFMKKHKLSHLCTFQPDKNNESQILISHDQEKVFLSPLRIGIILDYLSEISRKDKAADFFYIPIGKGRVDCIRGLHEPDDRDPVRLTEKEIEILTYLYKNNTRIVQKQELLASVWSYAENVETHTLETHIYRLRQKIEKDPSAPKYLVTEENGYRLY